MSTEQLSSVQEAPFRTSLSVPDGTVTHRSKGVCRPLSSIYFHEKELDTFKCPPIKTVFHLRTFRSQGKHWTT